MPETLADPEYAAVIGMLMYAHRARLARGTQAPTFGDKLKGLFAKKGS
jgi:hypothetical protein